MFLQAVGFIAVWSIFAVGLVRILNHHINSTKKDTTDAR